MPANSSNEYQREYRKKNADKIKEINKKAHVRRMGLSPETLQEMISDQGGACAICGVVPKRFRDGLPIRALSIDHDHACCPGGQSCGKCVRGLICNDCNRILGMVGDSTDYLKALINYLEHPPYTQ